MKFKITIAILFLNLSVAPLLHQHSYAVEPDIHSQFTQIDKAFINEWAQYQSIVLTNQLEKFNLEDLSIELDRSVYDYRTAKLFKQMLQHPKNSILRLEKLYPKNAQLKELIQLNIREYQFDLQDLEQDFGITKVEYNNDEYMSLLNQKHHNYIAFKSLREIINNKVVSMMLNNPLSSQNQNDSPKNLVNDWFRYQDAKNKINRLQQQIEAFSSQYLKEADDVASNKLKQHIEQYTENVQKILEQVKPKSEQVTEQIKQENNSLQLRTKYLRNDFAMRGIEGLLEKYDHDESSDRTLDRNYFELIQKLKKNEYQIDREVMNYLLNNPI